MKERPILFSGPMVQAILAGRKTQTRRVVKPQPGDDYTNNSKISYDADGDCIWWQMPGPVVMTGAKNKFGKPGDRLWVKETFAMNGNQKDDAIYAATWDDGSGLGAKSWAKCGGKWTSPIYMKRKFSRILLEIVSVRVERLQSISEQDSKAEGIESSPGTYAQRFWKHYGANCHLGYLRPAESYRTLWESINGSGAWAKNPWVWVVEFKRV